jgi:hypothetical protein
MRGSLPEHTHEMKIEHVPRTALSGLFQIAQVEAISENGLHQILKNCTDLVTSPGCVRVHTPQSDFAGF